MKDEKIKGNWVCGRSGKKKRTSFIFCTFLKIRPICACQLDLVPSIILILKLVSKKSEGSS